MYWTKKVSGKNGRRIKWSKNEARMVQQARKVNAFCTWLTISEEQRDSQFKFFGKWLDL